MKRKTKSQLKGIGLTLVFMLLFTSFLGAFPSATLAATTKATQSHPQNVTCDKSYAGKKILFDNTHGETAGAADWTIDGGFSDFADGLRSCGFTVDQLDRSIPYTFGEQAITYDKLKPYDVFILGEANVPFKASEQAALLQYVKDGGSVFFIGDHYNSDRNLNRWDSGEIYNGYRRGAFDDPTKGMTAEEAHSPAMQGVTSSDWLGQNFGLRFRSNALGDITSGETVVTPDQSFEITEGVTTVEMHAGSTLAILNPNHAKGLIYMPENPPAWANAVDQGVYNNGGIAEGAFSAISKVGLGKAAFIGDSSPVEDSTPKYLREDNGQPKSTFDGFSTEGQDGQYLVQLVEWLSNQESYTSFDQVPGLELSPKTTLYNWEEPANSTEPQPEPWSNPTGGYKWYDPSTFKPGSYGSTQQPAVQPTYAFVHQSTLPNAQDFQIRVTVDHLLPGQTLSGLSIGMYLSGGQQIAKFQNPDGSWPTSYGYSSTFSVTADSMGHASKDLTVKLNSTLTGSANLRLKVNGTNKLTDTVSIDNVPAEPLPKDHPPVPDPISIQNARHTSDGTLVTVEGVVTSEPGVFGGQGFYLQDGTGGLYVYQNQAGFHVGDRLSISATKTTYNSELELENLVAVNKLGTSKLPDPKVDSVLSDDNQGERVTLQGEIQNYISASPVGSFEFDLINASSSTHVRVDGRTGISADAFKAKFPEGSTVSITGISSIFKGTYQLKTLSLDAVSLIDVTPPTTTVKADGIPDDGKYTNKNVTLTFSATDNVNGSGVAETEIRLNGGQWEAADGPMTVSTEGRNAVDYRSVDKAGNTEKTHSIQVWIDKTGPVISAPYQLAVYQTDPSFHWPIQVTDALSGVYTTTASLDGESLDLSKAFSPLDLSAGPHTLKVTALDNVGNQTNRTLEIECQMDLDHFKTLISMGEDKGWIKTHGTAQSLLSHVAAIQRKNKDNSQKELVLLEDQIKKEAGKLITDDFSEKLLDDLKYIQQHL